LTAGVDMRRFLFRLLNAFRPSAAENDHMREITAHLALLEDDYRRRGLSADDATRAARRAMGSVALANDLHRDTRSLVWLDDLRRDIRHAVRAMRRSPGFTLVAVLALGLGIGVNTTFFTLVNAICLRGLPIDSPDRVMYLSTRTQDRPGNLSYAEFDDLRARGSAFAQVAAYTITTAAVADDRQPPARVSGAYLSAGAFELLGDPPRLGRTFRADEDRPGSPPVVILGSELWSTRYASDPAIVGQSITVNGVPSVIIGVMPRGVMFPANADIWRPMASLPAAVRESRSERRLAVFARLAPDATVDRARAEVAAIGETWAREFPASNRDVSTRIVPINEQLNPSVMQRAWIAFITAGALVLLVACANVANLLLMRAATRSREMAIRTSIGATRGRVIRQVLVESATLAVLAAAVGLTVAWIGLRVLDGIVPPETLPYWMAFTMDGRVFASVTAVCLFSVFACGLPSALHVMKVDLRDALTDGGATANFARPARRWITTLLAAEFAVTFVLIAVAVMSVRTEIRDRRRDFQIDPALLLTMWVSLPPESYASVPARQAFFDRFDDRIRASSAITSLAHASVLPYGGGTQQPLTVFGRAPDATLPVVSVVAASERYFAVIGVPIVQGRGFTATDGRPGSEVAIVNERFVRMFFSGEDPIGARIRVGSGETPWLQIIGVATTIRQQVVGPEADPVVFLPFRAAPLPTSVILVRTATEDATAAIAQLRDEVAQMDPILPLYRVMPFEQAVRNALWNGRLSTVIIRSIAVMALILALVGLYAVTGHTVERWTRELGLRIALGAPTAQIGWLVLKRVLGQLAIGLAVGILGSLAFDRLFNNPRGPVDRVGMTDPGALAFVILAIGVIAFAACLLPVRRATTVDPVQTLRS
jgi:putative ABC transport system permease protein